MSRNVDIDVVSPGVVRGGISVVVNGESVASVDCILYDPDASVCGSDTIDLCVKSCNPAVDRLTSHFSEDEPFDVVIERPDVTVTMEYCYIVDVTTDADMDGVPATVFEVDFLDIDEYTEVV